MSGMAHDADPNRDRLLERAIWLSVVSVAWGLAAGALSVVAGIEAGSLGVFGLGLNILADVTGSTALIWRFRVEKKVSTRAERAEASASIVVGTALSVVGITLSVAAITELSSGSSPDKSLLALIAAGISAVVLAPLGWTKQNTGRKLGSHALKGDGTLSIIGSALGVTAALGLLANDFLGWWWADRCAAIGISVVAGVEAIRVVRNRPHFENG